jgi:hypothetical protein
MIAFTIARSADARHAVALFGPEFQGAFAPAIRHEAATDAPARPAPRRAADPAGAAPAVQRRIDLFGTEPASSWATRVLLAPRRAAPAATHAPVFA